MDRKKAKIRLQILLVNRCDTCRYGDGKCTQNCEFREAVDIAIEALNANNVEYADIVRISVTDRNKEKVVLYDAFGEVEYYPTKLYTHEEAWGICDLISRADAIEAIKSRQTEQWIDTDVDYNNGLESAIAEIKALPSAKPIELIKGDDKEWDTTQKSES